MSTLKPAAWRIVTARLELLPFGVEHTAVFRAFIDRNNEFLRPWIPWMRDEPMSLAATRERMLRFREAFEAGTEFRYALLREGELIGHGMLHTRPGNGALETGYLLDASAAGCGYALEATAAMVRAAIEVQQATRVEIHCAPENRASARIPEKLAFTHRVTEPTSSEDSEGVMRDTMIWTLEANEYPESPAQAVAVQAFDAHGRPQHMAGRTPASHSS